MFGTIIINVYVGILAMLITFVTALSGNVFFVSMERALYAFILFFLATFPIRWLVAFILVTPSVETTQISDPQGDGDAPSHSVAEFPDTSENEPPETFTPYALSGIERVDPANDPNTIADVIRRLTDE